MGYACFLLGSFLIFPELFDEEAELSKSTAADKLD
jgi:hypothetical protein